MKKPGIAGLFSVVQHMPSSDEIDCPAYFSKTRSNSMSGTLWGSIEIVL